jgi:cation diffusion facilitator CzcD-associated flavoprotein CzcO
MVAVPSGFPAVVVGAGQAGLAVSYELTARGIEHVVLERARVGQTWRGLWDSFCLVTPNWTMSLPGAPYRATTPKASSPATRLSDTCSGTRRASGRRFARASAWTASSPDPAVGSCFAPRPASCPRRRLLCVRVPISGPIAPRLQPGSRTRCW